jgi:alpha-tubulin suppressor-like RCC1 family protein
VTTGGNHTCALNAAKNVLCWGSNQYGQLGIGTNGSAVSVPGSVLVDATTTLGDIVALASGYNFNCAVSSSKGLKCWGSNKNGQLGNNTTTDAYFPVDVLIPNGSPLTNVIGVAAGYNNACALLIGGGVKCWGLNTVGQLGNNSLTSSSVAVDVCADSTCTAALTGATAIAVGQTHSCALMSDSGVKCWGYNWYGELGNGASGTSSNRTTPVDVIGGNGKALSGVQAISAGQDFTCAISTQGTYCWGTNADGELGIATSTGKTAVPTAVSLPPSTSLASLSQHACAVTNASSVQCWGLNTRGQVGNNPSTTQNIAPPSDVVDGSGGKLVGVNLVAAGGLHSCALKTDGSIVCWGDNSVGQLGDGTTTNRLVPVNVALQH